MKLVEATTHYPGATQPAVDRLTLTVPAGEICVLVGPFGCGKTTAMRMVNRIIDMTAPGAIVATLGQDRDALKAAASIAAGVRALTGLSETTARTALAAFGLGADESTRSARTLSPGERTRAKLAVVAYQRATCVLLDEPTNHLDMRSLEVLEHALAGWPGGLLVATHDRALRRSLALKREVRL